MRTPVFVGRGVVGACIMALPWCNAGAGQTRTVCSWLALGGGLSSLGFTAASAALSVQVDHLLVSARLTGNNSQLFGGEAYEDYGLLVGYGWRAKPVRMGLAGGVGMVHGWEFQGPWLDLFGHGQGTWVDKGTALGFPLEIQAFIPICRFFGVGTYYFCNINPFRSFSGATVTLVFGKLW
ncbi:MAG: hypothetical protein ONB17_02005 [candidate division KSB1 bacterium]|nr:hypothetical protein [candidate division KSB1 bacterium]